MNRLHRRVWLALVGIALFSAGSVSAKEDRDTLVRKDKSELEDSDIWIYNDLASGIAQAKKTGQPLVVVFR